MNADWQAFEADLAAPDEIDDSGYTRGDLARYMADPADMHGTIERVQRQIAADVGMTPAQWRRRAIEIESVQPAESTNGLENPAPDVARCDFCGLFLPYGFALLRWADVGETSDGRNHVRVATYHPDCAEVAA